MRSLITRAARLAFLLLPLILTGGQAAAAKWWKWTEPRNYHYATVVVSAQGHGGTGVLVSADGVIVTAHHVLEGRTRATATWWNGHKSSGEIINSDPRRDLAAFKVSSVPEGAIVARVADATPDAGELLDHCGFGGPASLDRNVRRFTAAMLRHESERNVIISKGNVISGDSGGPVFNKAGELVGIISGGANQKDVGLRDQHGGPWPLVYPTRMADTESIRNLLFKRRKIRTQRGYRYMAPVCPPGGT